MWLSLFSYVSHARLTLRLLLASHIQETHPSSGWVRKGGCWSLSKVGGGHTPISQDASRSIIKAMSPPLGSNRGPLGVVGSGFPTRSDLAVQMDADKRLIRLSSVYGAPTTCHKDSEDPRWSKTDEVPAPVEPAFP